MFSDFFFPPQNFYRWPGQLLLAFVLSLAKCFLAVCSPCITVALTLKGARLTKCPTPPFDWSGRTIHLLLLNSRDNPTWMENVSIRSSSVFNWFPNILNGVHKGKSNVWSHLLICLSSSPSYFAVQLHFFNINTNTAFFLFSLFSLWDVLIFSPQFCHRCIRIWESCLHRNLPIQVSVGALGVPAFSILVGPVAPQRQAPTLFIWHVAWRCQKYRHAFTWRRLRQPLSPLS